MTKHEPGVRTRQRGALACALGCGLTLIAIAAGAQTPQSPAAPAPPAPAAKTYLINGVTINWNAPAQRFEAPSAEAQARLQREMAAAIAERAASWGLATRAGEPELVTLPNGLRRVRVPAEHLSFSMLRLGADGAAVDSCVDGAAAAERLLKTPVATPGEER